MISRLLLHAVAIANALSNAVAAAPAPSSSVISWEDIVKSGTTSSKTPGSFTINQVKNPNWTPRTVNYTELYIHTLRKYGNHIPEAVYDSVRSRDLEKRQMTLTGEYADGLWAFPIQVGTPAQTLYVWFDTGSADLWVFSDLMPTSESEGHTVYGPDASSSATLFSGQTFDISYGSGSASGAVYSETLTIGSTDGSFTIGGYPLEAATDASDSFTSAYAMSGLFGLDMSTTQLQGPTSEITYMYFLDAYVGITLFTVNFQAWSGGTWTFGTLDSSQYTGSISYTPAYNFDGYGYWGMNITSYDIEIDGSTAEVELILPIILDTGSSISIFPSFVCSDYWSQVSGAELYNGQYVFPCSTTLPDFPFTASGGATATLYGEYLNYGPLSGYVPDSTYCYGALQPTDGTSVLALGLYQSMFVVFDYGGSQIGFATKDLP